MEEHKYKFKEVECKVNKLKMLGVTCRLVRQNKTKILRITGMARRIDKIVVPDGVEEIVIRSDGSVDIGILKLPKTIRSIRYNIFRLCKDYSIDTIELSDECTEIVDRAFQSTNIKGMVMGNGIRTIGENAFFGSLLTSIKFSDDLANIPESCCESCYMLRDVTLGKGCKVIGESAFMYDRSLSNIIIPESVEKIEKEAFGGSKLKRIEIPKSCKVIGRKAFSGCDSLDNVILHEGLERIEYGAFEDCCALSEIVVPDSCEYISPDAFRGVDRIRVLNSRGLNHDRYDKSKDMLSSLFSEVMVE